MNRTYDDFLGLVSDSRNMSVDEVAEVAQGRVWSGSQAKERKLVDQTGTLREAADAAARIAGLGADYVMVYDQWELSRFEALLIDMMGNAMSRFNLTMSRYRLLGNDLLENILDDLEFLAAGNEGLTVAAHCLCDAN